MNKNSAKKIWSPFHLSIAFLAGILLTLFFFPNGSLNRQHNRTSNEQMSKFKEILQYVNQYYVDTVNNEQLFETAVNSMLQSLDPHSTYANAVINKAMQESLDGAFEGIGVQFNIRRDTVMVVAVTTGGPSEKTGIRAGDRIVTVDDEDFTGKEINNDKVMKTLRGKKGSIVKLGIKREGFAQIYHYNIKRDVIPTHTVDVAYMIDKEIGYVKINQFGSTTAEEFAGALVKLKKQGMSKLILDLRDNPGGYLDAAVKVCDEFLSSGELIVYTEGLRVKPEKIHATRYGHFEKGEVVVLLNDFSASASEIVAGAIQDNDRGWVVGRRSFGKGLVQRQFNLEDQSTVRLTVSRYHTPSGRSIQKDYQVGSEDYAEELYHRYTNGEMDSVENIQFDETLAYKTKKGRTVYGGGGIMPDHFIPLDRDSNLTAFYQILNAAVLSEYAFDYTTKHQNRIKAQFPDAKTYVEKMVVDNTMLQEMVQQYNQKHPEARLSPNAASAKELKLWLKAIIGRNLYHEDAFYPLINQSDKTILKAKEIL